MTTSTMPLIWAMQRNAEPEKFKNFGALKKFNDIVLEFSKNDSITHIDMVAVLDHRSKIITFSEGTADFNLFKVVRCNDFIRHFEKVGLWKTQSIDNKILEVYKKFGSKYKMSEEIEKYNFNYSLLLMQNIREKRPMEVFVDCLTYAKEHGQHIVFKLHPFGHHTIEDIEKIIDEKNLNSEFVHLTTANTKKLIEGSDRVITSDSSAVYYALLSRKPTFIFYKNEYHEMCKRVTFVEECFEPSNQELPDLDDVKRFFSWHYHTLSIHVDDPNIRKRIKYIIDCVEKGMHNEDIFVGR